MGIRLGGLAPGGFIQGEPPAISLETWGYVYVHLSGLTVGGIYLMDCTVAGSPTRRWAAGAPVNSVLAPTGGHILGAFAATSATHEFFLQPDSSINVKLYRCEFIKAG